MKVFFTAMFSTWHLHHGNQLQTFAIVKALSHIETAQYIFYLLLRYQLKHQVVLQ
jgi:hypothetical protein